jgi:hypothetical protein
MAPEKVVQTQVDPQLTEKEPHELNPMELQKKARLCLLDLLHFCTH